MQAGRPIVVETLEEKKGSNGFKYLDMKIYLG